MKINMKISEVIYEKLKKLGITEYLCDRQLLKAEMKSDDYESEERKFITKGLKNALFVVMGFGLLSVVAFCANEEKLMKNNRILRPEPGKGADDCELSIMVDEVPEAISITVPVEERRPEGEELENLFQQITEYLEKNVLGENESPECISSDLRFETSVPGTSAKVVWKEIGTGYLYSDGRIKKEKIKENTIITLSAEIECYGEIRGHIFSLCLVPEQQTEADVLREKIIALINTNNKPESGEVLLPDSVDGKAIKWAEKTGYLHFVIGGAGILALCLVFPSLNAELRKEHERHKQQMEQDYPDLVSKFVLLYSAGMTVRGVWFRICEDYCESREKGTEIRFVYEKMLLTKNQMEMGMSERVAYRIFGEEIGLAHYKRFAGILERNLKRGSKDMLQTLETEAEEAVETARSIARQQAELTGTRLLIPMVGMLVLVMAVIIVPAFASFG